MASEGLPDASPARPSHRRKPGQPEERSCERCKTPFRSRLAWQKFCSSKCRRAANAEFVGSDLELPSGTVGAMHELLACADLLRRGLDVYRSVSPNAKSDLVVVRKDRPLREAIRVEVTTGYRRQDESGRYYHAKRNREHFDVLAIVFHDGSVLYEPDNAWT